MTIFEAVILGVVQGITEVFPVSSSGHLFLVESWLGLAPELSLEILLHAGSLLAIIIFFWKDIWELLQKVLKRERDAWVFCGKLLLATVITGVVGVLLQEKLVDHLSVVSVGGTLLITAGLIFLSDFLSNKSVQKTGVLSWSMTAVLGLVQALAVLPGLSRSGLTIAFLLSIGLKPKAALMISFFLGIPTMAGATVFTITKEGIGVVTLPVIIGFILAFIFSLVSLQLFYQSVRKYWRYWGVYCVVVGLGLLVIFR